jgi:hypothetical protein
MAPRKDSTGRPRRGTRPKSAGAPSQKATRGILDGVPETATQGDPTMQWVRSTTEKMVEAGGG